MTLDPGAESVGLSDTKSARDHITPVRQAKRKIPVNERRAEVLALIKAMKLRGNTTLAGIAKELNERGVPALRGGQWTATQVSRVL